MLQSARSVIRSERLALLHFRGSQGTNTSNHGNERKVGVAEQEGTAGEATRRQSREEAEDVGGVFMGVGEDEERINGKSQGLHITTEEADSVQGRVLESLRRVCGLCCLASDEHYVCTDGGRTRHFKEFRGEVEAALGFVFDTLVPDWLQAIPQSEW